MLQVMYYLDSFVNTEPLPLVQFSSFSLEKSVTQFFKIYPVFIVLLKLVIYFLFKFELFFIVMLQIVSFPKSLIHVVLLILNL